MTVELKRMLQRRGNKQDLPSPSSLRDGELFLVLDDKEMFFSANGELVRVSSQNDVIDNLLSTDTDKALSANQGRELDHKINDFNSYWQNYIDNVIGDIENKQDTILYKGETPPNNIDLFWQKTE